MWRLVLKLEHQFVKGTKWVFKNKIDEYSMVIRNKDRLVAQRHNQEEGIDFDKTFEHVARLESIRMLLALNVIRTSLCIKWMSKVHF